MKNTLLFVGGILISSATPSIINPGNLHKAVDAFESSYMRKTSNAEIAPHGTQFRLSGASAACKDVGKSDIQRLCQ